MENPIIVSTTVDTQKDAEHIANALLRARHIACAQISGPLESLYWWKDDITGSVEFVLSVKTFDSHYDKVEKAILEEHPYDVPEIIAEPITRVSAGYLEWMGREIHR